MLRGCLVYVFKQQFLVFKQHFTHSNALFHPHIFPQIFLNNNFQFLNTHTKQVLMLLQNSCRWTLYVKAVLWFKFIQSSFHWLQLILRILGFHFPLVACILICIKLSFDSISGSRNQHTFILFCEMHAFILSSQD